MPIPWPAAIALYFMCGFLTAFIMAKLDVATDDPFLFAIGFLLWWAVALFGLLCGIGILVMQIARVK